VKLIQVGIGRRGHHWLDFLNGRPEVQTVACVDVDQAALDAVRDRTGGKFYTSLGRALAETAADAVLITSPSEAHAEQARQALRARKSDEAYQDWLRQMRDRAYVELRLEEK